MQVYQGFKLLGNTSVEMLNGQTLKVTTTADKAFTGGIQRESAVGSGSSPRPSSSRKASPSGSARS